MASTYAIYERLNIAGAKEAGFPPISPELERLLGTVGDDVVVKVLRFLNPFLLDSAETISGRAVFRLLGYRSYNDFVRVMFKGQNGVPAAMPAHKYRVVEKSIGGRTEQDHLLKPEGLRMASIMGSDANSGWLARDFRGLALDIEKGFARLMHNFNDGKYTAFLATLAAAEAEAVAAAEARGSLEDPKQAAETALDEALAPLVAALERVKLGPQSTDAKYIDNTDFRRLVRAFISMCVGTLEGHEVRCAGKYTSMVMAVTGVCVLFPTNVLSVAAATNGLQRAIKERIRLWTGHVLTCWMDMTTQQLYTFMNNFVGWYVGFCRGQLFQSTLDDKVVVPTDIGVPIEMAVWLGAIQDKFPNIRPLDLGRTVSLDTPLADRGEQIKGQTQLDVYVQRGRLGRRRKVAHLQKHEGPVDVVVIADSDSE